MKKKKGLLKLVSVVIATVILTASTSIQLLRVPEASANLLGTLGPSSTTCSVGETKGFSTSMNGSLETTNNVLIQITGGAAELLSVTLPGKGTTNFGPGVISHSDSNISTSGSVIISITCTGIGSGGIQVNFTSASYPLSTSSTYNSSAAITNNFSTLTPSSQIINTSHSHLGGTTDHDFNISINDGDTDSQTIDLAFGSCDPGFSFAGFVTGLDSYSTTLKYTQQLDGSSGTFNCTITATDDGVPARVTQGTYTVVVENQPLTTVNNCSSLPITIGVNTPTTLGQLVASNITGATLIIEVDFTLTDADDIGESVFESSTLPSWLSISGGSITGPMTTNNTYTAELTIDSATYQPETVSFLFEEASHLGATSSCGFGQSGGGRRHESATISVLLVTDLNQVKQDQKNEQDELSGVAQATNENGLNTSTKRICEEYTLLVDSEGKFIVDYGQDVPEEFQKTLQLSADASLALETLYSSGLNYYDESLFAESQPKGYVFEEGFEVELTSSNYIRGGINSSKDYSF
jgi:hypothetical protein